MNEEKKMILQMLKDEKITVDEAEKLISSVSSEEQESSPSHSLNKKFLRIIMTEGTNTKVNMNIPLALAEVGLKLIPKETLKIEGQEIDPKALLELIQEGQSGELVNIETNEKGKDVKVKIFVD